VVELQPCGHVMCADCFLVFPQKLKSTKCPACTQEICTFGPDHQNFIGLIERAKLNGEVADSEQDLIGETLDHQFFLEEIKKILSLSTLLINERELKYRGSFYKDALSLHQIRERLLDLRFACQQYELFDANQRLVEIHEIHEMLLKIQSGSLDM